MEEFKKGDRVVVHYSEVFAHIFLKDGVFQGSVGKIIGRVTWSKNVFYVVHNPEWVNYSRSFKATLLKKF